MQTVKVLGELTWESNGVEVRRQITGYAYPRNGNCHNPTPRVSWLVYRGGRLVYRAATLRDAKQCAREDFGA